MSAATLWRIWSAILAGAFTAFMALSLDSYRESGDLTTLLYTVLWFGLAVSQALGVRLWGSGPGNEPPGTKPAARR